MTSLLALPAEIRMRIWRYAILYEVEIHINNSAFSEITKITPTNPSVPLLLTCRKALYEVAELPSPSITVKSSGSWYLNFRNYMDVAGARVKQAMSRITFVLNVYTTVNGKEPPESSVMCGETGIHVSLLRYVRVVKSGVSRPTAKQSSTSGCWYGRKLTYEVSDCSPGAALAVRAE